MEERPDGNDELEGRDVFDVLNPYFLLFFGLSCILGSVFIQEIFVMAQQFRLGMSVAPAVGMILPIYLLTRRFRAGFTGQMLIRKPEPRITFFLVAATLASVVVVDFIYVFSLRFLPEPTDYIAGLQDLKPDGTGSLVVTFVGLCVAVPLAEEIVFRGIIQRVFTRHIGSTMAVILAGTFFGVIHLNPQLLLSMTAFGIFLGVVFLFTGNLVYTILAHAVLNTVAFVQLVAATDVDAGTAPFYLEHYWMLGVALVLLVLFVTRIKKEASE